MSAAIGVERLCDLDGCARKHWGRGYCRLHYSRWLKHGDPLVNLRPTLNMSLAERFDFYTPNRGDGCWEWTGSRLSNGYGVLSRTITAHRWAQATFNGPIPDGHDVRHACDNPPCVNPAHLSTGTRQQNVQDSVDRRRNHHGDRHRSAIFTSAQVAEMRRLHASGMKPQEIKTLFGVRGVYIYELLRPNNLWKNAWTTQ